MQPMSSPPWGLPLADLNRVDHVLDEEKSFDLCDSKRNQQHHLFDQHHRLLIRQRAVIVQIRPEETESPPPKSVSSALQIKRPLFLSGKGDPVSMQK